MKVTILKEISFRDLAEKVRAVPLMKKDASGNQIRVYERANISIKELKSEEVNPTTFYILQEGITMQRELREALLKEGIDSLRLDRAYEIMNERGEIWTLTPPIIEVTPRVVTFVAQEGEIAYPQQVKLEIPIINDGAHRVSLARELGMTFNALYISGADPRYPFYAHPNSWSQVRVVKEVPKTKAEKKMYSREDCYGLYRDFGVLGCGAPRGTGK